MISIDESCLKCFDNFLNFNVSNHFVNKCVNKYHKRFTEMWQLGKGIHTI